VNGECHVHGSVILKKPVDGQCYVYGSVVVVKKLVEKK
jgi:hypothetical protein